MAARTGQSGIVYFTVPGDPEVYFAIRRADGRYWACNRWRGWRLQGVGCTRVRPILVAGDDRIVVTLTEQPAEVAA
jgi:hypothetical protein